jgi:hypothetical protein
MAKSIYEVGEKEKHTLTVDHDWATKHIRIELANRLYLMMEDPKTGRMNCRLLKKSS